jgi:hypothetical protein
MVDAGKDAERCFLEWQITAPALDAIRKLLDARSVACYLVAACEGYEDIAEWERSRTAYFPEEPFDVTLLTMRPYDQWIRIESRDTLAPLNLERHLPMTPMYVVGHDGKAWRCHTVQAAYNVIAKYVH